MINISTEHCFPSNLLEILTVRHKILHSIRKYFESVDYLEVETPMLVFSPGIDPYIDAIRAGKDFYLSTSPELQMKRLLTLGVQRIYQITHAFRENEKGTHHNPEFTILEWYHSKINYKNMMQEVEQLVYHLFHESSFAFPAQKKYTFPFPCISVDKLFYDFAGWEPSYLWDEDRFYFDWIDKIEPHLKLSGGVFVTDYPAPLASLSKLNNDNPLLCERFELYLGGIEVANAYTELVEPIEQIKRFRNYQKKRKKMGKESYTIDTKFIAALEHGIPECAGAAIGVDRLIMSILDINDIQQVQAFPFDRL
jgi:lysyl-tRNA synthetase class 2